MKNENGFTLLEVAIGLLLIGVFLSSTVQLASSVQEHKIREQSEKEMKAAVKSIYGFILLNGRLPCPDTNNDYIEDITAGNCTSATGNLPARDIGVREISPMGGVYQYTVDTRFTLPNSFNEAEDIAATNADEIGNSQGLAKITAVSSVTPAITVEERVGYYEAAWYIVSSQ